MARPARHSHWPRLLSSGKAGQDDALSRFSTAFGLCALITTSLHQLTPTQSHILIVFRIGFSRVLRRHVTSWAGPWAALFPRGIRWGPGWRGGRSPCSGRTRTLEPIQNQLYTVKKRFAIFPSPAGMSLTKLSLAGNNLNIPVQGEFG